MVTLFAEHRRTASAASTPSTLRGVRPAVGFEDPRLRQTFASGFADIRDGLPYLGAIAIQGALVGALVGVAGTLTGLSAPWWAVLLAPVGILAIGLAAGLVLRYAGPVALRRLPHVPAVAIAAVLSAVGALAAFFPLWSFATARNQAETGR
jgi:hypothetical protein